MKYIPAVTAVPIILGFCWIIVVPGTHPPSTRLLVARVNHDFAQLHDLINSETLDHSEVVKFRMRDPFSAHGSYQLLLTEGGLFIYSVGPDGLDGDAQVHYDPTNGSASQGDIFLLLRE